MSHGADDLQPSGQGLSALRNGFADNSSRIFDHHPSMSPIPHIGTPVAHGGTRAHSGSYGKSGTIRGPTDDRPRLGDKLSESLPHRQRRKGSSEERRVGKCGTQTG